MAASLKHRRTFSQMTMCSCRSSAVRQNEPMSRGRRMGGPGCVSSGIRQAACAGPGGLRVAAGLRSFTSTRLSSPLPSQGIQRVEPGMLLRAYRSSVDRGAVLGQVRWAGFARSRGVLDRGAQSWAELRTTYSPGSVRSHGEAAPRPRTIVNGRRSQQAGHHP